MKPYTPMTDGGRTTGGDDIHHKTADQPRAAAKMSAKASRHGARQAARRSIALSLVESQVARAA